MSYCHVVPLTALSPLYPICALTLGCDWIGERRRPSSEVVSAIKIQARRYRTGESDQSVVQLECPGNRCTRSSNLVHWARVRRCSNQRGPDLRSQSRSQYFIRLAEPFLPAFVRSWRALLQVVGPFMERGCLTLTLILPGLLLERKSVFKIVPEYVRGVEISRKKT